MTPKERRAYQDGVRKRIRQKIEQSKRYAEAIAAVIAIKWRIVGEEETKGSEQVQ